tara:strand:+ start:415 stop:603 length:189 start_codon:yes stop_codon:yes gene_type:complete
MYLFKPFKTQDECDKALEHLLSRFSRDIEKLRITQFLGRFQTTNEQKINNSNAYENGSGKLL